MILRTIPEANLLTSFLAWLAVDSRKPTQLYFVSDSRRSWRNGVYRDDLTKLFVAEKSPDIFALLGDDITFPEAALPDVCAQIDRGAIPPGQALSVHGRTEWVLNAMQGMKRAAPPCGDFTVFHGSRHRWGNLAIFGLSRHRFVSADDQWISDEFDLARTESHAVSFDGSGGRLVYLGVEMHTKAVGAVSRAFFSGFTAALRNELDKRSGGAPQLIGLGSVGYGRHYGLVTANGTVFRGKPTLPQDVPAGTQWRDDNLEPVDSSGTSSRNRRRKVLR